MWKEYFLPKSGRLDRHKVSALTLHYYIKHSPIIPGSKSGKIALSFIINELVAFTIALGNLKAGGRPYEKNKTFRAAMYKVINNHSNRLNNHYESYQEFIPDFVTLICIILYNIESARMVT